MCVCVCVYIYIYIYIYIHIYAHIYIHTYIHTHTYIHMHSRYLQTRRELFLKMHIYIHTHTYLHTYTQQVCPYSTRTASQDKTRSALLHTNGCWSPRRSPARSRIKVCMRTHVYVGQDVCMWASVWVSIYVYTYTYTYIYICIHIMFILFICIHIMFILFQLSLSLSVSLFLSFLWLCNVKEKISWHKLCCVYTSLMYTSCS